jgi:hypothetical protein
MEAIVEFILDREPVDLHDPLSRADGLGHSLSERFDPEPFPRHGRDIPL